ncbi:MAG: histone deacetylase family protein [Chloroflexota bacterium]
MRIYYDPAHAHHHPGTMLSYGIPYASEEVPERVELIRAGLAQAGFNDLHAPSDYGLAPLQAVHTPGFLEFLQRGYVLQRRRTPQAGPLLGETFAVRPARHTPRHPSGLAGYYGFGTGSPLDEHTWDAASRAAQCALSAAQALLDGQPLAYALCRPPGHHAAADLYGGFCYLNNAAIAARRLQQALNRRVAVLDIDYHHGNGTQEIFYHDPRVLFVSLHAHPDDEYPYYWGGEDETGAGPGLGFNRNFCLPQGCTDAVYLAALDRALAHIAAFNPAALVISLGLDTAEGDPVGGFCISAGGFQSIGRRIAGLQAQSRTPTGIRPGCLVVQEGGYHMDTLGQSAAAFFVGLAG